METRIRGSKRRMAAIMLAAAMLCSTETMAVSASETTTYTLDDDNTSKTGSVTAKFTIGDTELSALGYTTTVSIPNEVALTLKDGKFSGTGYIGVSGIIDSAQTISISIDTDNAAYKVVKGPLGYSKDLSSLSPDKFYEHLGKNGWSASQTHANLEDKTAGKAISAWTEPGTIEVSIDGKAFVPRYKGNYSTAIPLTIELKGA
ncbi:MAG: hypothetical protein IJ682_00975 [Lachnospiraceae bacterium]|nr:hypothetical protein [Lachnospiraceae bacterium]